ncbi:histidine kinase [Actinoplanes sp. NPDC026619]|uniref:sensor histidine kinase n=1 Tax=Actinoplanes sp. NPDC026619 TaxID=3155798 RepID=UPI0033C1B52E
MSRLLGLALLLTGLGDLWIPAQVAAFAAFTVALLGYPQGTPGRGELLAAGGGAAVLGAVTVTVLPDLSHPLLFGVALPAVGLLLLRQRGRDDLTAAGRARVRLLFAVVAGTAAAGSVLLLAGVVLLDPAPLRWLSHLGPAAIAAGPLATPRRLRPVLLVVLVTALLGGPFFVLLSLAGVLPAAITAALLLTFAYRFVERWVDHLLHGRRPTPYSVLAGIGAMSQVDRADAPDLARIAEAVGRGLGTRVCRLTVHRADRPDRTYAWPDGGAGETDVLTLPIARGDERFGSITVDRATGHRHRLVADVADSLVPVLEAHRLGIELERQLRAVRAHAADIAGSRRRLVAEMDAERRRIERDLHDGAQHQLVSLRLSLGLAEHRLSTGSSADAVAALDRVSRQIDDAEDILARTATGVSSPLLAQEGLVAALRAELGGIVTAAGMPAGRRFPANLEAAVWFCCLEAAGNARKHAPGAAVRVALTCGPDRLAFGVHDDGPGFDMGAATGTAGRGMRNVLARLSAVGGAVSVRSEPGAGTRVDGWVPLPTPTDHALVITAREAIEEALIQYAETAPTIAAPTVPAPAVPAPAVPAPAVPAPAVPAPAVPAPAVPAPAGPGPAAPGPAGSGPAGSGPAGSGPAGSGLAGSGPAGSGPAGFGFEGSVPVEKLRGIRAGLREVPAERRAAVRAAWAALRTLDELVRAEPPATGGEVLLHRLDRIRSGTHELAEVDAIDALRSGAGDFDAALAEAAARLLGETGADARSRLGLDPGTEPPAVAAAAEQALVAWRRRAVQPGVSPGARELATTIVRSCEQLLQAG